MVWSFLGLIVASSAWMVQLIEIVPWFEVTIGGSAFFYLLDLYLDLRQIRQLSKNRLPGIFHDYIDPQQFSEMQRWSISRMRFLRLESTLGFVLELAVLFWQLLPRLWSLVLRGLGPAGLAEHKIVRGVAFILAVSVLSSVVRAPFEIARVLFVDSRFEVQLAHKTLRGWFSDQLTMCLISLGCGVPILAASLALLESNFPYHWLVVSVLVSLVGFFFSDLYPKQLATLFNTFTPLADGPLAHSIRELARRLDFPLQQILVVDGSRRAGHCNAYISGFGRSKQIVLYDTLLAHLRPPEILAVLGHELGHHRFNHTWKQLLCQLVFLGNFIFVFSRVLQSPAFFAAFGFTQGPADASVALLLFGYMFTAPSNVLLAVNNWVSRSFEYTCDEYAVRTQPNLPLEHALIKLHVYNPATLMPDHLYSAYHYSHPSLMERLEHLQLVRARLGLPAPPAPSASSSSPSVGAGGPGAAGGSGQTHPKKLA